MTTTTTTEILENIRKATVKYMDEFYPLNCGKEIGELNRLFELHYNRLVKEELGFELPWPVWTGEETYGPGRYYVLNLNA